MATVMVRDRNYEGPGFDDVRAVTESGRLNRTHALQCSLNGRVGTVALRSLEPYPDKILRCSGLTRFKRSTL